MDIESIKNTVIQGDCLEVMKQLPDKSIDFILTDPPYPDYLAEEYGYFDGIIDGLNNFTCPQMVFWTAKQNFPLDYTAIHIWDKKCGVGSMYERIFERNGGNNWEVYNYYLINSTVAAKFTKDTFSGHPSQKPIALLRDLINKYTKKGDTVLDPFAGSGGVGVACKELGRNYILIEREPKYIEIINKRLENITPSLF